MGLFKKKPELLEETPLSRFFLNTPAREQKKILKRVLHEASKSQRALMEEVGVPIHPPASNDGQKKTPRFTR